MRPVVVDPALTYVMPIRRISPEVNEELTDYLRGLSSRVDLVVVDNSPPEVFSSNHKAWGAWCRHVRPWPCFGQPGNPKVANVMTGVALARQDVIVVADDDVRWDDSSLARAASLAQHCDLVRPQNYFSPLVWHARWDTARSLINRAIGDDFPGTLVVRRSAVESAGGYDGDALFENLELIRTIETSGGRVINAPDLFVRRLPPTTARFWSQRIRQAYDDFALPVRMFMWLCLLPALALVGRLFGPAGLAGVAVTAVMVAEFGRRRKGGRQVFPADGSLWAPVWLAERAVCAWLACGTRLLIGGVRYNGSVLSCAAHSPRQIRRRLCARSCQPPAPLGEIR